MDFERGDPQRRFWCKAQIAGEDDCWNWHAAIITNGYPYGLFRLDSKRPMQLAHRCAWVFTNGEIKDGLFVLHKCDNPRCINPKHLYLGDQYQNVQDRVARRGVQSADT